MCIPEGIKFEGHNKFPCKRTIYGLRQAACSWNKTLDTAILSFDPRLKRHPIDPCLYFIHDGDLLFFINVYVDDLIIACNDDKFRDKMLKHIKSKFELTFDPVVNRLCGVDIDYVKGKHVTFSQHREIKELVSIYEIGQTKADTPMDSKFDFSVTREEGDKVIDVPYPKLLGSLLWIARNSRPDIMPAVIILSRYNKSYTMYHWSALIRVLRYLHCTEDYKLYYTKQSAIEAESECSKILQNKLAKPIFQQYKSSYHTNKKQLLPIVTYSDSDWATCKITRKSLSGRCTFVSGNLIAWVSSRQNVVALSSCEAEYIAAADAAKDGTYISNLINEIFPDMYDPRISSAPLVNLLCDNQGAIHMALNEVNNSRTKHIDIRHHYIRDKLLDNFTISKVHTDDNVADIFTKPLDGPKFTKFTKMLGIRI